MTLLADLEEFVHDHRPHGTSAATELRLERLPTHRSVPVRGGVRVRGGEFDPCACLGKGPSLLLPAHAGLRQIVRFCACGHLWTCGQDVNESLAVAESGSAVRARVLGGRRAHCGTLRLSLCFDHAGKAMAARTHVVCGRKTVGLAQTERDHCGRGERCPNARSKTLRANVAWVLLQESDHAFTKTQHGAPTRPAPSARDAPDSRLG